MIAICVSGLAREGYERSLDIAQKIFPYDFFFAHWKNRPKPNISNLLLVDEPTYEYHNLLDTSLKPTCPIFERYVKKPRGKIFRKPELLDKTKDHSKQILIHQSLVDTLPKKYSTIIRMRYDTILSEKINFKKLFDLAEQDCVIGVAGSQPGVDVDSPLKLHKEKDCKRCTGWYLWDHIIFHKRYRLKNSYKLYHEKNLLGAEWGWYQVLLHQWNDKNYINVSGGNALIKHLK